MSETVIMQQLAEAVTLDPGWRVLAPYFSGENQSFGIHLAVMVEPYLSYVLAGRKTIESRFSKNLIPPYMHIAPDDLVLLKAGPVVGAFRTASVECVDFDETAKRRLRQDYSDAICADDEFWGTRDDKNYATLIGIADVLNLPPVPIAKRDRRGWLVLRSPNRMRDEQLHLL